MDYSLTVNKLISKQMLDWPEAGRNYAALAQVRQRTLHEGEASVTLQFNPERRRSSAANISPKALARRKCFLCTEHQPARQSAVLWGGHYKIQVNPYPIFSRHLTIADQNHEPQRLSGRVGDMLRLAQDLPGFVVFYNGPQCGASAPDHMHFQAGLSSELPLCAELPHATTALLANSDEGFIGFMESLGRTMFNIETTTMRAAERHVLRLMDMLPVPHGAAEAMVNVLCWWDVTDHMWRVVVFPRSKHRPDCYGEGEGRLLLSPASVDMGELWAVPEEKDFDALTIKAVQDLYRELCMSRESLGGLLAAYKRRWSY